MSDTPIDLAVYSELKATTGAEFVVELVDTFLAEMPGMLAELRGARTEANAERFRRAAHSLKSNANTFGAVRLAAQARELELKGLDADTARDEAAVAALETESARAAAALKALRNG
jgi:histidine phosphotransfer protein HptB